MGHQSRLHTPTFLPQEIPHHNHKATQIRINMLLVMPIVLMILLVEPWIIHFKNDILQYIWTESSDKKLANYQGTSATYT